MSVTPGILEDHYDFVIAGHGNAALTAAAAACDRGKSVLVLEAAPEDFYGGNSRYVEVYRAAHRGEFGVHYARPDDVYTEDDYYNDIVSRNEGDTDPKVARVLADRSLETMKWLATHGVKFTNIVFGHRNWDPDMGRSGFRILGGGMMLMRTLLRSINRTGGRCRFIYNAKVVDMELEGMQFRRAVVEYMGSKTLKIAGDNLVIASGSFVANLQKMREIYGPAFDNFKIRGAQYNTGEPLFAMMRHGAATVGDMHYVHAPGQDARAPRFNGGISMRVDAPPVGVVLNKYGLRFHDEGEDLWIKKYSKWGYYIIDQPDQLAFSIWDSKGWGLFTPTYIPPISANSLEELVNKLTEFGLENPAQALETIREFNRACPPYKGESIDLGVLDGRATTGITPRKSNWSIPIDTPPFYAYPMRPGVTFVYWSLRVDEHARVLHESGNPFPNIYAAGESMFATVFRKAYIGGGGIGVGATFGIIAAHEGGWL
jgi:tricarballylate dehydrogenase